MGSEAPSLMETMAGTHAVSTEESAADYPVASDSTSGALPIDRAMSLMLQADLAIETAILALKEASRLDPHDLAILEKLSALATAAGDHRGAVDARVAIAEAIEDHRARALAFVAAARLAGRDVATVGRAVALFEAAIADDPAVPGAFEATIGVLISHADWTGVDAAYVRQLERLGRAGADVDAIATILEALAVVRAERLGDRLGAIQALDKLVALRPTSIEARARHAALLEENGQYALARDALETLVTLDPQRAESLRALHRLHVRARSTDRAYGTAMSLVYLGEADDATLALYHRFAPRGLVAPMRPFDAQIWDLLAADDHPREVAEIIFAIAPAALAMRLETMRAAGQVSRPDPREKQDAERSTVAAVRTVAWAARLLGGRIPDVYARGSSETAIALVPQSDPGIQLGRPVLTGRALPELAFLLASELAFQRCTGRLASLYPTMADLGSIVLAGVAVAMPRATHE
ncbi:MAG: tetratricopeptide repeat protein, partial [Polyangiales bacterium]